jgi:hypothetical protein
MYKLGKTAIWLQENYDKYPTRKEAAKAIEVSETRLFQLCQKLNITKWNKPPRIKVNPRPLKMNICEQCGAETINLRFCSKQCQGKYTAAHYGWGTDYHYSVTHLGEMKPTPEDLHGSGPVQEAIDFIERGIG